MSVENFKRFGQLCAEDEKIREKVKEIGVENIDGWIEYSKNELGLEFTKEDMQTLAAEVGPVDELSEEQLEQVAGGFVTSTAASVVRVVASGVSVAAGLASAAASVGSAIKRW